MTFDELETMFFDLQARYDIMAEHIGRMAEERKKIIMLLNDIVPRLSEHDQELVDMKAILYRPGVRPSAEAEPYVHIAPPTKNAPTRQFFDASGFLLSIGERTKETAA